jgi:hypothetical protein
MRTRRVLRTTVVLAVAALAASSLVACGDDEGTGATTDAVTTVPETEPPETEPPGTEPPETEPPETVPPETTGPVTTVPETEPPATEPPATTVPSGLEQPAIWPAADVVFTTPEEAAADFVAAVLGDGPTLGEFMAGDSRSGEMLLFSPGEGANPVAVERGLLLLRQLGPDSGWFVTAVVNDEASITTPEAGATVPAGPLSVEGVGHGFEANLVARAWLAGDASVEFDLEITTAGSMEEAGPYSVVLDLSAAQPGDVVMILVRTGAGLETDPGEVGAIAVTID